MLATIGPATLTTLLNAVHRSRRFKTGPPLPATELRAVAFVSVGSPQYTFSASAVVDNGMVQIPTWNSTAKSYDDLLIPLEVLLPTTADRAIPLTGRLAAQCGVRTYVQLDTIS